MDRARVICPSISFAAHVTGATILGLAMLLLPERLPPTRTPASGGSWLGPRVDLGRAPGGGGRGPAAPRVPPPSRPGGPAIVPPLGPGSTLGMGEGGRGGIPGFPDGPGDGDGLCVVDCGPAAPPELPVISEKEREPIRMKGGDLRAPVKVRHVAPIYPVLAVTARAEGRIVLDCLIDERGRVTSVVVVETHPLFVAAAVEAVRQWRYNPTLLNGEVVSVQLEVIVDFRLR